MSPEEKDLVERSLKISEENNKLLKSLHRNMRRGQLWEVIKILVIVLPLIFGYLYLRPYLGPLGTMFDQAKSLLEGLR